jgi:hypothetical protein
LRLIADHRFLMTDTNGPLPRLSAVMAGLVPAIQVLSLFAFQDVDARHKAGQDGDNQCPLV